MVERTGVALLRGGALNPYEMQSYALLSTEFDVLAIGSKDRANPTEYVDIPVRLLPTPRSLAAQLVGSRPTALTARKLSNLGMPWLDVDRLLGLERSVEGRSILHSAETVLPVSQQAAELVAKGSQRLVLTCWETIPFRYDDDPQLSRRKEIVKDAAHLYLAVTERARSALVTEGVPEEKISVVPAGVDCSRFAPSQKSHSLLRDWEIPSYHPVVLYVGRLIQEKGLLELVRAFALMAHRKAHLVFLGAGNQEARIVRAARALGVAERVRVRPAAPYRSLPQIYATADVVVAPSLPTPYWEEQFGMVLVETMACGRPLVTTGSGAIPQVVGDAAYVVPPYDVPALAEALEEVLSDEQLASRLSEAGRTRATSLYDVNLVANAIATQYRRVLS